MSILSIYGPEFAQFLRRGETIDDVREQSARHHEAMEREEGLEEDVVDAKHVEAETKKCGANDVHKDQDRELEGEGQAVLSADRRPSGR